MKGVLDNKTSITEKYHNTAMTSKGLVKNSHTSLANYIRMWTTLSFNFWDQYLKTSIISGKPPLTIYEWFSQEPERWNLFQEAMKELARITANEIDGKIRIPSMKSRKLLDLGGGHGLYSIKFCRKNPQLSATIFDLPLAIESVCKNVASSVDAEKIGNRISF